MRLLRHDLHSLSGAYALDAIEPGPERDRFVRHLSRCPSCASEVRGFGEVTTALAFAAADEAPAGLRDRVLAEAAQTRQLPPEVGVRTHARPRQPRTPVPWVPWLSGAIATAAIAVAVFFGFAQAHTQNELDQARAENAAISVLLAQPKARLLTHAVTNGGVATVVLAADRHELAVVTTGLPALPHGKVYQLWLIGKKITSAGLLPPASNGQTPAVLADGVVKGDALGLTIEPAGGSAQPTTKPILALPLPV
jgi:anti-sigma-K factor RskA